MSKKKFKNMREKVYYWKKKNARLRNEERENLLRIIDSLLAIINRYEEELKISQRNRR